MADFEAVSQRVPESLLVRGPRSVAHRLVEYRTGKGQIGSGNGMRVQHNCWNRAWDAWASAESPDEKRRLFRIAMDTPMW